MFSLEFLLTSFIVVVIPGTGVIYTLSTGLLQGGKASLFASLGCTLGIVPHILVSILGLGFILTMSPSLFQAIKILGALYLLYLAWSMWRDKTELSFDVATAQTPPFQIMLKAILINVLNPKLSIFFLAFLPQFISPESSSLLLDMVFLSLMFMILTLLVFILYGVLASYLRRYLLSAPRAMLWIRRCFALSFVLLSLKLLFTD